MEVMLALAVFGLSHVAIARGGLKAWVTARFGRGPYLAGYSGLSLLLMAWVVLAILRAERWPLWVTPDWAHGFALLATACAFALLGAGAVTPNPLSAAFVRTPYDPARPGLVGWVRHPVVAAFGLWGAAHVPANGEWPGLALFAGSALFALLGAHAVTRRLRRSMEPEAWQMLQPAKGHLTIRAMIGAMAGLLLWAVMLVAHPWLFGVDPLTWKLDLQ
ncbi:MAG: NnrU family protein [Beijerinckiaceae bacterium]|jgi:uncharacterized membrane protein|nr:NnrU family protein [Beijerinckiaceae bacterium]